MNALEGLFTVDFEGQFALQKRGKLGTQSQKKRNRRLTVALL
jgi:hypothetical protein